MLRLFGSAVLISQLKIASAAECAAYYDSYGQVIPLDTCYYGITKYYCENGVAYSASGFAEEDCGGDATYVSEVDLTENDVYCDADPCEVATVNYCTDADCEADCTTFERVLDQCTPKGDEPGKYESTYCASSGLTQATYTDSECSSEESSYPLVYLESALGAADGCFSIDSECEDGETAGTYTSCCDGDCVTFPIITDLCNVFTDEDTGEQQSTQVYCDPDCGLMTALYADSECSDETLALPFEQFMGLAGDDTDCLTFNITDCVGSGDCAGANITNTTDCPTGVIYAQLDGDEDVEMPYIPLGLCNEFGSTGTVMVECDDSGVPNFNVYYVSDSCSGTPSFSGPIIPELSDANDTTTFRAACNTEVPCTFARFTVTEYEDDGCSDTTAQQTVSVGDCVSNGTVSFMVSCDDTSVTRATYMSLDCTGDAVDEANMLYELNGDERCPGEVVDCFMMDDGDDSDGDGGDGGDGGDEGGDDGDNEGGEEDPEDNSGVSKIVVNQLALLSVAIAGSLLA